MNIVLNFIQDDEGTSAIEYALLALLIAVVIIGGVTTVGTTLQGIFSSVAGKI